MEAVNAKTACLNVFRHAAPIDNAAMVFTAEREQPRNLGHVNRELQSNPNAERLQFTHLLNNWAA